MKKTIAILLILLSLAGLIDSLYLSAKHFDGGDVTCSIGGSEFGNCTSVLRSEYATVGSIPVALIGALYYFALFVLSAFLLTNESPKLLQIMFSIVTIGFLISLWFIYLQFFVLHALCPYCLLSGGITLTTFALILFKLFSKVAPSAINGLAEEQ